MARLTRIIAVGCVALLPTTAKADIYPERPITLVIGFAPGSGIDTVGRILAGHVGRALKQSIVVENKVGANAAIAATHVARAKPDGYTLFIGSASSLSANPSLLKNISYDPVKDFAPVSLSFAYMLVVHPGVPPRSIGELIAYARANPGKLSYASSNTSGLVAGMTFVRWAGLNITHIPYKSAPPAINDVLGGRVSMMFADVTTALPHVRANALRGMAVIASQRSALLPDLPSLSEIGLADFDSPSWNGIVAPANTPRNVISRLNAEVLKVVGDPAIKTQLAGLGFEAYSSTPDQMEDFVKAQIIKWSRLVKDAGIEMQ